MTEPVIPQTDPGAAYRALKPAIDLAVAQTLESGWYILGEQVKRFEQEFAAYLGTEHAVGVANGTDALALALRALGVGPGDLVATVSHTAVATVAAIELTGARPYLFDVDPNDFTLDVDELATALAQGLRPRAIIAVHLYGQAARLHEICALGDRYGTPIVEDCAQAHGATLDGARLGTLATAAAFSFYPTKNLGALGDGGMVVTGDAPLAARLRAIREYGWRDRYVSAVTGQNSRLDELQAAILRVKLPSLDRDNERRRAIAAQYDHGLETTGHRRPQQRPGTTHVYHQYVLTTDRRDDLRARLDERGIRTAIHYPVPVHRQPAYAGRIAIGPAGQRHTEALVGRILSLPMYPQMSDTAVQRVVAALSDLG